MYREGANNAVKNVQDGTLHMKEQNTIVNLSSSQDLAQCLLFLYIFNVFLIQFLLRFVSLVRYFGAKHHHQLGPTIAGPPPHPSIPWGRGLNQLRSVAC